MLKLIVVVVRIDEIADERYAKDSLRQKKKREHFADAIEECKKNILSQMHSRLQDAWKYGSDPLPEGKADTLNRIIDEMQVFPVSAVQYRKLLAKDDDDRHSCHLRTRSGIPGLETALKTLSQDFIQAKAERFVEAYDTSESD